MDTCVIVCAGGFSGFLEPPGKSDHIIAADGGLTHLSAAGLQPDTILGDFDSLGYVPEGATVFPVEKDDTDAMLAVRHGLSQGFRRFLLYGTLDGPRLDHTVANFQTLQFLADRGAEGYLIGENTIAAVVKNKSLTFPAGKAGNLSVFCMGSDARGVSLSGLKYSLEDGQLSAGFPLGVSNRLTGEAATVSVRDGSLLVLWDRNAGLPTV